VTESHELSAAVYVPSGVYAKSKSLPDFLVKVADFNKRRLLPWDTV